MTPAQAVDKIYAEHNGQPWEVSDSSNLDQCYDLFYGYIDTLGIPRATAQHLYAYQIFTQPNDLTRQYFDIIPYYPGFVAQKGDVGVYGTAVGFAGHVTVEIGGGNAQTHPSFDQNWDTANHHAPDGEPICRVVNHTYNGFLGVLRPKNQGNSSGGNQVSVLDLARARVLSWGVLGRNGYDGSQNALDGKTDGELNANHVGQDAADAIWQFYQSEEGARWRNRLDAAYAKASQTDKVNQQLKDANAQIDALKIELGQKQSVDPNSIVISQKGWQALFDAVKSFFNKNN